MKKIKYLCVLCLFLLVGCSKSNEIEVPTSEVINPYVKGEYALKLPYDLSDARYWHGSAMSKFDAIQVEKGLSERSKEYFSTSNYIQSSGTLIGADEVKMLQRRESEEYAYALNPGLGTFEVNEAISVKSPYIVYDVVEVNYYDPNDLDKIAGIGVTILMNSDVSVSQDSSTTSITIDDERLYTFGSNAGRKLERYIRTLSGVSPDCPIYISLYASASSNSSVPGTFVGDAYFTGRSGQFERIQEDWILYPTSSAQAMDGTSYSLFVALKSEITHFLPENVDVIGIGRFEDKQLRDLNIDINVQAKTYNEVNALTQIVSNYLAAQDTSEYDVTVEIKMFDTTYFTLVKSSGDTNISVHDIS